MSAGSPGRPLRVLLVSLSRNDPFGGASRVFHLLRDGLARRGHEVVLLHREDLPQVDRYPRLVQRLALPRLASAAAAERRPQDFDVVLSASGMLHPLFARLGSGRTMRVHHLLGAAFFDRQAKLEEASRGHQRLSLLYRLATGRLPLQWDIEAARLADLVTVNCRRDWDFLVDQGIPEGRCRWIPLAVHPTLLARRTPPDIAPARRPRSAIWFGSWSDRKGIAYLPRAWRMVLARFPDAQLTLGGTGIDEAAVQACFAGMDTTNIRVLGRIDIAEQVSQFERHSVFLFPSLSEGFGFALLEAMACGLACVTTMTGMGGDLVRDHHDAVIVPPASAIHLAGAIISLFDDDALRAGIGAQARHTAEAYTLDRLARSYEQVFSQYHRADRTQDDRQGISDD